MFAEQGLTAGGIPNQLCPFLLIHLHDHFLQRKVIKPSGARRNPPTAKQAIDLDAALVTCVESDLDFRPVLIALDGLSPGLPHAVHIHQGPHGSLDP